VATDVLATLPPGSDAVCFRAWEPRGPLRTIRLVYGGESGPAAGVACVLHPGLPGECPGIQVRTDSAGHLSPPFRVGYVDVVDREWRALGGRAWFGPDRDETIRLVPRERAEIVLVDAHSMAPLVGWRIAPPIPVPGWRWERTAEDGRLSLPLFPGAQTWLVASDGGRRVQAFALREPSLRTCVRLGSVLLALPPCDYVTELEVVDGEGAACAGAEAFIGGVGAPTSLPPAGNGTFVVEHAAGQAPGFQVTLTAPAFCPRTISLEEGIPSIRVPLQRAAERVLSFTMAGGGTVPDDSLVTIWSDGPEEYAEEERALRTFTGTTLGGRVRVPALPVGGSTAYVRMWGGDEQSAPHWFGKVEIPPALRGGKPIVVYVGAGTRQSLGMLREDARGEQRVLASGLAWLRFAPLESAGIPDAELASELHRQLRGEEELCEPVWFHRLSEPSDLVAIPAGAHLLSLQIAQGDSWFAGTVGDGLGTREVVLREVNRHFEVVPLRVVLGSGVSVSCGWIQVRSTEPDQDGVRLVFRSPTDSFGFAYVPVNAEFQFTLSGRTSQGVDFASKEPIGLSSEEPARVVLVE